MIRVTATIINSIPVAICEVNGSPKTNTPTQTAVTGSIAPKTAVRVDPILCTACTNVIFEITVGTTANKIRLIHDCPSGMDCTPPFVCALKKNRQVLTIKT